MRLRRTTSVLDLAHALAAFQMWGDQERVHAREREAEGKSSSGCVHMIAAYERCAAYIEGMIDERQRQGLGK